MNKVTPLKVRGAINGAIGEVSEPYCKRGVPHVKITWQGNLKPYEVTVAQFNWSLQSRGLVVVSA